MVQLLCSILEIVYSVQLMNESGGAFLGALYVGVFGGLTCFTAIVAALPFKHITRASYFIAFIFCNLICFVVSIVGTAISSQMSLSLQSLSSCAYGRVGESSCSDYFPNIACTGAKKSFSFAGACAVSQSGYTDDDKGAFLPEHSCYCVFQGGSKSYQCATYDITDADCEALLHHFPQLFQLCFGFALGIVLTSTLLMFYRTEEAIFGKVFQGGPDDITTAQVASPTTAASCRRATVTLELSSLSLPATDHLVGPVLELSPIVLHDVVLLSPIVTNIDNGAVDDRDESVSDARDDTHSEEQKEYLGNATPDIETPAQRLDACQQRDRMHDSHDIGTVPASTCSVQMTRSGGYHQSLASSSVRSSIILAEAHQVEQEANPHFRYHVRVLSVHEVDENGDGDGDRVCRRDVELAEDAIAQLPA